MEPQVFDLQKFQKDLQQFKTMKEKNPSLSYWDYKKMTGDFVDQVNKSSADFVQRLQQTGRKTIPDWEYPTSVATHKLGWDYDQNGNPTIYPTVQNTIEIPYEDQGLHDFSNPMYRHNNWDAFDSALERGDTVQAPNTDLANWYTENNYKNYYPKFDEGTGQEGVQSGSDRTIWDYLDEYAENVEPHVANVGLVSGVSSFVTPNPVSTGVFLGSNILGAGIDAYQLGRSLYHKDYANAAKNAAELGLGLFGLKQLKNGINLRKASDPGIDWKKLKRKLENYVRTRGGSTVSSISSLFDIEDDSYVDAVSGESVPAYDEGTNSDGIQYTIKPGDTLTGIALKFTGRASNYKKLAELNNISNPDLIYAGNKLIIPTKDTIKRQSQPQTVTSDNLNENEVVVTPTRNRVERRPKPQTVSSNNLDEIVVTPKGKRVEDKNKNQTTSIPKIEFISDWYPEATSARSNVKTSTSTQTSSVNTTNSVNTTKALEQNIETEPEQESSETSYIDWNDNYEGLNPWLKDIPRRESNDVQQSVTNRRVEDNTQDYEESQPVQYQRWFTDQLRNIDPREGINLYPKSEYRPEYEPNVYKIPDPDEIGGYDLTFTASDPTGDIALNMLDRIFTTGYNGIKRKFYDQNQDDPETNINFEDVAQQPTDDTSAERDSTYLSSFVGDTIRSNNGWYYLPENLNARDFTYGVRNRGDYTPIESGVAPITTYRRFERVKDLGDWNGELLGVDKDGNLKIGTKSQFDPNDMVTPIWGRQVTSFAKDANGNQKWDPGSKVDNASKNIPVVNTITPNGEEEDFLNILVNKNDKNGVQYGPINGGRVLAVAGNDIRVLSGSVKDIEKGFEEMKARNGVKSVKMYLLDNGTFNRGLRTRSGKFTSNDLRSYDLMNTSGGHFMYITGDERSRKEREKIAELQKELARLEFYKEMAEYKNGIPPSQREITQRYQQLIEEVSSEALEDWFGFAEGTDEGGIQDPVSHIRDNVASELTPEQLQALQEQWAKEMSMSGAIRPVFDIRDAVDMTPFGDAATVYDMYNAVRGDQIGTAAMLGASLFVPGLLRKPLTRLGKRAKQALASAFDNEIPNVYHMLLSNERQNVDKHIGESLQRYANYLDDPEVISKVWDSGAAKEYDGAINEYLRKASSISDDRPFGGFEVSFPPTKESWSAAVPNNSLLGDIEAYGPYVGSAASPEISPEVAEVMMHEGSHLLDRSVSRNLVTKYNTALADKGNIKGFRAWFDYGVKHHTLPEHILSSGANYMDLSKEGRKAVRRNAKKYYDYITKPTEIHSYLGEATRRNWSEGKELFPYENFQQLKDAYKHPVAKDILSLYKDKKRLVRNLNKNLWMTLPAAAALRAVNTENDNQD